MKTLLISILIAVSLIHCTFKIGGTEETVKPVVTIVQAQAAPIPPAVVVSDAAKAERAVQFDCLAKTIYFEAGNQSPNGKLLVGLTVMNRLLDDRFPKTICEVVYEKGQFSWYWDGKSDRAPRNKSTDEATEWQNSQDVAQMLLSQSEQGLRKLISSFDANHYHATYVHPYWAKNKKYHFVAQVGQHKFYKWM